jgi:hypothetical protein
MKPPQTTNIPKATSLADQLAIVREKVDALAFGTVQLVVRDGRITEIQSTERTRIDPPIGKIR